MEEPQLHCENLSPSKGFTYTAENWKSGELRVVGFGQFQCNYPVEMDGALRLESNATFEVVRWFYSVDGSQENIGFLDELSDLDQFEINAKNLTGPIKIRSDETVQIFGETRTILAAQSGITPVTNLEVKLTFQRLGGRESTSLVGQIALGID